MKTVSLLLGEAGCHVLEATWNLQHSSPSHQCEGHSATHKWLSMLGRVALDLMAALPDVDGLSCWLKNESKCTAKCLVGLLGKAARTRKCASMVAKSFRWRVKTHC